MEKVKGRLTYANVMATIAVFVALGGGAYAASTAKKNSVTSKSVKNGSLQGVDVANDTLTGGNINESTLTSACPSGTIKAAGICFDAAERSAQGLSGAMDVCGQAGRYLPTPAELRTLHLVANVSVNGEQTSVFADTNNNNALATDSGLAISNSTSFARPFRCAVVPG